MKRTLPRIQSPTAILVGLSEELSTFCIEALTEGGLKVLRVGHVAAASERIPVVMPQLVILDASLTPADVEAMNDRCVAVGAAVIVVTRDANRTTLSVTLRRAARTALLTALGS